MSANKHQPHIYVLPEDDANRELVTGFQQELRDTRQLYAIEVARGWTDVLDRFKEVHVREMDRYPKRLMVLLIDFDGKDDRLERAKAVIPEKLIDRVFVLGVWTEPEKLKGPLLGSSLEDIGSALAQDCRDQTDITWSHELLRHNAGELDRIRDRARAILFN